VPLPPPPPSTVPPLAAPLPTHEPSRATASTRSPASGPARFLPLAVAPLAAGRPLPPLAFGLLPPPPTAAEAAAAAASSDGASVKAPGRALGSSNRMSSQTWRSAAKSPFDVPESKSSKSHRAAFATWSPKTGVSLGAETCRGTPEWGGKARPSPLRSVAAETTHGQRGLRLREQRCVGRRRAPPPRRLPVERRGLFHRRAPPRRARPDPPRSAAGGRHAGERHGHWRARVKVEARHLGVAVRVRVRVRRHEVALRRQPRGAACGREGVFKHLHERPRAPRQPRPCSTKMVKPHK
jgi:hypothetical protein